MYFTFFANFRLLNVKIHSICREGFSTISVMQNLHPSHCDSHLWNSRSVMLCKRRGGGGPFSGDCFSFGDHPTRISVRREEREAIIALGMLLSSHIKRRDFTLDPRRLSSTRQAVDKNDGYRVKERRG